MRAPGHPARLKAAAPYVRVGVVAVALAFGAVSAADDKPHTTWSSYLGSPDSNQYSALKQINKSNVKQLEVAWTFAAGTGTVRFDPLVVDGVMYVLGANRSIVALDAASGKEIWTHRNEGAVGDRGMNYWESKDRSERRLLYMNGGFLTSIDARTGNVMASFGDNGKVDVRIGLQRDVTNIRPLQTGNPGRIFENLIIMSLPASGAAYVANPGDTHAYDVRTGELKWVFHSVPAKGEFGADTWPEGFLGAGGGVHNWSELTVDEKRGIVYIPFGTARFDFYGGNRKGNNLFGNSLVALDARTGKRLWHYQLVHHDLWDYDLPQAPKLLTLRKDGRNVDVVAQATKHGFVFVFDRVTGAPFFPIEERPVPQTDVPGEWTSPTQPFPTAPPPFARQTFTEKDINPFLPRGGSGEVARDVQDRAQRRVVHAAEPPGHDFDARPQRRRQLGQHRRRSDERHDVHRQQEPADPRQADRAGRSGTAGARRTRRRRAGRSRCSGPRRARRGGAWRSGRSRRRSCWSGARWSRGPRPARRWSSASSGTAAERRPGLHRLHLAVRFPAPEQRALGDRSALVEHHRLRSEQRHHPLADSEWRVPRSGAGQPCTARRPGRDGRRFDLRGHLHRSQAARLRSGHRQGPVGARSAGGV